MEKPEILEKNSTFILGQKNAQIGSYIVEEDVVLPISVQQGDKLTNQRFKKEQPVSIVAVTENGVTFSSPEFLLDEFVHFEDLDKSKLKLRHSSSGELKSESVENNGF